jgi:hypothetical protein
MDHIKTGTCCRRYLLYNLGTLLLVVVLIQHIGGIAALKGADGSVHRKFGLVLSTIIKLIAVCGWLLVKN